MNDNIPAFERGTLEEFQAATNAPRRDPTERDCTHVLLIEFGGGGQTISLKIPDPSVSLIDELRKESTLLLVEGINTHGDHVIHAVQRASITEVYVHPIKKTEEDEK